MKNLLSIHPFKTCCSDSDLIVKAGKCEEGTWKGFRALELRDKHPRDHLLESLVFI